MSTAPKKRITPDEYLERERKAEIKSEYFRGEVFAMAGATFAHTRIKSNFERRLGNCLDGTDCVVLSSDQRIKVPVTQLYTYPDILVLCGKPEFEDDVFDTLLNPRVIGEILSESTEAYDRGAKFRHYQRIESLKEYLLISQDQPVIERFVRQPDGNWLLKTVTGLDGKLALESVPASLAMAELYEGISFKEPKAD